mmetsp:Transcript_6256/g.11134  ORF Transcript_6256/g.11134 Transcript_6256/m.11134 type:complete len:88 (-) Transcript_6256:349-612(-)
MRFLIGERGDAQCKPRLEMFNAPENGQSFTAEVGASRNKKPDSSPNIRFLGPKASAMKAPNTVASRSGLFCTNLMSRILPERSLRSL